MQLELNIKSSLSVKDLILLYLDLTKFRITISNAFTCMVGYLMFSSSFTSLMFYAVLGTFLIASGSASLNQYQEIEYDAIMKRTANRPMPSKKITSNHGLIVSISLAVIGYLVLYIGVNEIAAYLGVGALLLYNLVYTPMKRISVLAVFPGALIGAIPPIIGWVAAGGQVIDTQVLVLAFFLFFWQMPHFWLLVLLYDKDYIAAGYPTMTEKIGQMQLKRVTFVWIVNFAISTILFPIFSLVSSIYSIVIIVVSCIYMIWGSKSLLQEEFDRKLVGKTFMKINIFVLIVLFTLIVEKLIK